MKTNETAPERYAALQAEAATLIAKLQKAMAEETAQLKADGAKAHWGHVGDMHHIVTTLRDLAAFAAGEND